MDIRLLVMDVDGTLTDGKIYMGTEGEVMKAFNIKDGYGIHDLLIPCGIVPVVMTGRQSGIVEKRCSELGIEHIYQNISDKLGKLEEIVRKFECTLSEVAYIGDDLNDLACMLEVRKQNGVVACPADAVSGIRKISVYISGRNGGEGAVREIIEWLLRERK